MIVFFLKYNTKLIVLNKLRYKFAAIRKILRLAAALIFQLALLKSCQRFILL